MIEAGRVVAIETDALWVETQQQTTCGNCAAKQGCGQNLLQQLHPTRPNHLRVLMPTSHHSAQEPVQTYTLGDRVEFSLPDHIIVTGSLLVYLVPVIGLLLGSLLGGQLFAHEFAIIATALAGFCVAAATVRLLSKAYMNSSALQAQLVGRVQSSPMATPIQPPANVI